MRKYHFNVYVPVEPELKQKHTREETEDRLRNMLEFTGYVGSEIVFVEEFDGD